MCFFLQDLFDDASDRNTEDNDSKQDGNRTEAASSGFHFSLDEDTQFTQILNTQGWVPQLLAFTCLYNRWEKLLFLCANTNKDQALERLKSCQLSVNCLLVF